MILNSGMSTLLYVRLFEYMIDLREYAVKEEGTEGRVSSEEKSSPFFKETVYQLDGLTRSNNRRTK